MICNRIILTLLKRQNTGKKCFVFSKPILLWVESSIRNSIIPTYHVMSTKRSLYYSYRFTSLKKTFQHQTHCLNYDRNWSEKDTMELILPHLSGHQIGWDWRMHRLHPCRGVRLANECPGHDIKQSDGEAPVILELCVMRGTSSLPSNPCPL